MINMENFILFEISSVRFNSRMHISCSDDRICEKRLIELNG